MYTSINEFKTSYEETIRITCAGLARIMINDKYLLILNKNSVNVGTPSFGPLGGALEFIENARPFLETELGAIFENGYDLRMRIAVSKLEKFSRWFHSRQNREVSPLREVYEELHEEENIVRINISELHGTYVKTVMEDKLSNRAGQQGVKTKAFYEIFDVTITKRIEDEILEHIKHDPSPKLILASPEDFKTNKSIGTYCQYLI